MSLQELKKTTSAAKAVAMRTYQDIAAYLDARWSSAYTAQSKHSLIALDKALGNPSQTLKKVYVAGTNSKSLTIHFTSRLFGEESLQCGALYAPHIRLYQERICIGTQEISEKAFVDLACEVIEKVETVAPDASSTEILCMITMLHSVRNNVEFALFEIDKFSQNHPLSAFIPDILTITRVTGKMGTEKQEELNQEIFEVMQLAGSGTHVITGDQTKHSVSCMQKLAEEKKCVWEMPIRKLVPLPYPYEQIHGRAAALAERISQTYVKKFIEPFIAATSNGVLIKTKGKKGRPTLEAKKELELNPQKTLDQFWCKTIAQLSGRFELLAQEKPNVLLDTASNLDAIENVLFGVRLLHYQKPLKGITLVIGATAKNLEQETFMKILRYFAKKTGGMVAICPVQEFVPGSYESDSWNAETMTNNIKGLKIKAKMFKTFVEAYNYAAQSVDSKDGLVVITGSKSIVHAYWNLQKQLAA
ncbi:MAG: hypothetical protein UU47_C0011G0011 [candidate division TM6 bacterium GW2011_GWE2_41_16]|nr:MAG: hypothetical protein UU47_C0011G0011 [candidate division TM6 bacterium GW2011_GWE2_41_16]